MHVYACFNSNGFHEYFRMIYQCYLRKVFSDCLYYVYGVFCDVDVEMHCEYFAILPCTFILPEMCL